MCRHILCWGLTVHQPCNNPPSPKECPIRNISRPTSKNSAATTTVPTLTAESIIDGLSERRAFNPSIHAHRALLHIAHCALRIAHCTDAGGAKRASLFRMMHWLCTPRPPWQGTWGGKNVKSARPGSAGSPKSPTRDDVCNAALCAASPWISHPTQRSKSWNVHFDKVKSCQSALWSAAGQKEWLWTFERTLEETHRLYSQHNYNNFINWTHNRANMYYKGVEHLQKGTKPWASAKGRA